MTVDQEKGYVVFTEEMKHTHTILVPNMQIGRAHV